MGLFDFLKNNSSTDPEQDHAVNFGVGSNNGNSASEKITIDLNTSKGIYNFGRLNDYPQTLIELYDTSPTNQAVINRTALMIAGGNTELDAKDKSNVLNLVHAIGLQKYPNPRENLESILFNVGLDAKLHGRYGFICTWNEAHDRVVQIKSADAQGIRVELDDEGNIKSLKYSKDWKDSRVNIKTYEPFNKFGKNTEQLLYVQFLRSGHDVYGLPDYYASLKWIALEKEIGDHYLSSAQDGFSPKVAVSFPGKPESTKIEDETMDALNKNYSGARGRKVIGIFSPRPELMPKFEAIGVENIDKQYSVIDSQAESKILTGHGVVSPLLFGIKTPGQLGGTSELQTAFNIYQKTVIAPYQNSVQRSLDHILDASGNPNRILLTEFDIINEQNIEIEGDATSNKVAEALNSMSPLVATKVLENLTINEIRALGGLDPVSDGDTVKSQIQATPPNF